MRPIDVEQWVVRAVERVTAGQPREDDRIEFKARLPEDHRKAARRIAGHANQARHDRILWIIGIDENAEDPISGLAGDQVDLTSWWQQVESLFDEVAPSPTIVHVPVDKDRVLLGLGFDTSRPPYVLRLTTDDPSREVPWREGVHIRSAKRYDLLRILVPLLDKPQLTVLSGQLSVKVEESELQPDHLTWNGFVMTYLDHPAGHTTIFPDHRCSTEVQIEGSQPLRLDSTDLHVGARGWGINQQAPGGRMAQRGDSQLVVTGPGPVQVNFFGTSALNAVDDMNKPGELRLHLETGGLDRVELDVSSALEATDSEDQRPVAHWSVVCP